MGAYLSGQANSTARPTVPINSQLTLMVYYLFLLFLSYLGGSKTFLPSARSGYDGNTASSSGNKMLESVFRLNAAQCLFFWAAFHLLLYTRMVSVSL